jgi:peptidoglycan/xylan/chitin deacetylase (PgdA/CDA1 family)
MLHDGDRADKMAHYNIILNFHGIGEPTRPLEYGEDKYWISKGLFTDILDYVAGKADVQVTFDDGNVSDYEFALPALKQRGLAACVFISVDRIGEASFLSREQITILRAEGMRIGSHGAGHQCWPKCRGPELDKELVTARAQLEDIVGAEVTDAACPFGAYNRRVLGRLRALGYRAVYTSDGGAAGADDWIRPRNTVLSSYGLDGIRRIVESRPHCVPSWCHAVKLFAKRWR